MVEVFIVVVATVVDSGLAVEEGTFEAFDSFDMFVDVVEFSGRAVVTIAAVVFSKAADTSVFANVVEVSEDISSSVVDGTSEVVAQDAAFPVLLEHELTSAVASLLWVRGGTV